MRLHRSQETAMIALPAEAVARLGLQPGQTYTTTLDGREIEILVREASPPAAPADEEPSQFADMVMLNMFLDIPPSPNAIIVKATPGKLPLPDPPIIPPDYDEAEE
jgi:hypothetical protein